MNKKLSIQDEVTEFLLYTAPGGGVKVEVILNDETIWLTQQRIADLFGVQRPAITKHLKNIYESGELDKNTTSSILEHVGETRQTYTTKYYNLDAIISVGYRVNSRKATQFRIWATQQGWRKIKLGGLAYIRREKYKPSDSQPARCVELEN